MKRALEKSVTINSNRLERRVAEVYINAKPEFTISSWEQLRRGPTEDGMLVNPCRPSGFAAGNTSLHSCLSIHGITASLILTTVIHKIMQRAWRDPSRPFFLGTI